MKTNLKHGRVAIALTALFIATAAIAATALSISAAVNVSQTTTPTEKAKFARLAFQDGGTFKNAWLYVYGDGEVGRENVYARYSFDDGVTWSDPILLSRDELGDPTGGQSIKTKGGYTFIADNNKPNLYSPPATDHPNVVVTWTSAYCPEDPAAANSGSYSSNFQGQSALVDGGTIDHPFFCLWTATTTDPALSSWTVAQLTNGERDAIGDVATGNSKGQGFALAWQEDPAGLKPGEAEGPGDGGSGATVSPGTNIWYTYAPTPDGATFRTNIRQASDNNSAVTGAPGASRPNLSMSGNNAVLVYEETACPGGSSGKCIRYHNFLYNAPTFSTVPGAEGEPGAIVSDPTKNARRVRVVLQGAEAAPASDLRALLLWRESAAAAGEGAPADIVIRRGLVRAGVAGSNGFKADDILADTPQKMTELAAGCGNANAHRALIRNNFIALAYDITPSMDGANPDKSNPTTANYNLVLTRSFDSGTTWDTPRNLSNLTDMSVRVVEPRIVPTPGTIINPISGVPDTSDTQDTNTFFIAYATEGNDTTAAAGKVYVSRTTDQGETFEAFVPVSNAAAGQSESQLRATPDGSVVAALWMQEQDNGNKDAMFAMATPVANEPLATTTPAVISGGVCPAPTNPPPPLPPGYVTGGSGCSAATGQQPLDPVLPVLAVLALIGLVARRWRSDRKSSRIFYLSIKP
jgi:MYXO-CTERM domain-containing protein